MTPIARVFAVREGVSPRQAQEAVRAATDILEWRLGMRAARMADRQIGAGVD